MVTHQARVRRGLAALGALAFVAGLAIVQPAQADDDDWHTEADRPAATTQAAPDPQSRMEYDGPLARGLTNKPAHETLYAPPGHFAALRWSQPATNDFQTADVDVRR